MAIGAELEDALRSFAIAERDIVSAGQLKNGDNAMELVRVRRDLVLQFAKVGNALEQDPHLKAHPDKLTEGTRLFAAFRSANSINQANWPAIRVRDEREAYRSASQPVIERSRAFWAWVDQELGFRR
jgi:hypothetical protein